MLAANCEYFATLFCSQLNESSGEIIYFGEESKDEERYLRIFRFSFIDIRSIVSPIKDGSD